MSSVYLDYNSTTPLLSQTWQKLEPWFLNKYGNASSTTHRYGWQAADAVKQAREYIAQYLGASDSSEIYFNSGATEGVNTALTGIFGAYKHKGGHIISIKTEHNAVLGTLKYLESLGAEITLLDVDKHGTINLNELKNIIREDTIAVCTMLANNETGMIHPIKQISDIVHNKNCIVVCDATQAVGKTHVNINELGVDVLVFSGHKFYATKGVGGMYVRRKSPRVKLSPLIHGGGHENGLRSGTLNVSGILSMYYSLQLIEKDLTTEIDRQIELRYFFENELICNFDSEIVASNAIRLPNTTMVKFANTKAEKLITQMPDFSFSMGSACTSSSPEPSHVLTAMGYTEKESKGAIRVSTGRHTTKNDLERFITKLKTII